MVWYALIRELPGIVGIMTGGVVAALFLLKNPGSSVEPIVAALAPPIIAALARSKPAESETIQRMTGAAGAGLGALAWLWLRQHMIGGLMLLASVCGLGAAVTLLSGCSASQQQAEIADFKIAAADVKCVLEKWSTSVAAGEQWEIAILVAAVNCQVPQHISAAIVDAHRNAMVNQGYVPPPASTAGPPDSGRRD